MKVEDPRSLSLRSVQFVSLFINNIKNKLVVTEIPGPPSPRAGCRRLPPIHMIRSSPVPNYTTQLAASIILAVATWKGTTALLVHARMICVHLEAGRTVPHSREAS
jgi:hypothetical protein